jgi:sugar phosphate isomerase/epimerase
MLAMTTDFHGTSKNSTDIKNTLTRIAQAGFSHIHWCHEFGSSYIYSNYEMFQIKEWCDELGLKTKGVHASVGEGKSTGLKYYASENEYNRLAGVELVMNRIDLAYTLNTDAIVLHFYPSWDLMEKSNGSVDISTDIILRPFLKSFGELEAYCKTRRIKICLEHCGGPTALNIRFYDCIFNHFNSDFIGICVDTGHAYHDHHEKYFEFAERYNNRLFMIHADDNHGNSDAHLLPFEGGFDWEGFAPILARSPYQFPIVLEPSCREEGDDTAWLKRAFDAGTRFAAMAEQCRRVGR